MEKAEKKDGKKLNITKESNIDNVKMNAGDIIDVSL